MAPESAWTSGGSVLVMVRGQDDDVIILTEIKLLHFAREIDFLAFRNTTMSITHGIRTLGVLGAGQMGTGIALVSALRAKVPVLLHDRSAEQMTKGLAFVDKLLEKDVSKGRITSDEAKDARSRIEPANGLADLRDVDMVVEVCSR